MIGANHHSNHFRRYIFQSSVLDAPKNILGPVAGKAKVKLPEDTHIDGKVGIGPDGQGFGLAVTLSVTLPGLEQAQAEELVNTAHQVCPYSNATRGNIPVDLEVHV